MPYGIYDVAANTGWVNVGTDHDTAAFTVESIRRWWNGAGRATYPTADRLLITADAGGSNEYRTRTWKTELTQFAAESGLTITICHLPPGTSKWNRIEHRLFSHITMNWRGRPLTSHEVIIESIAAATTKTGLTVHAELDTNPYPTGIQVSDDEIAALPITRHRFHGDWNYTLHPGAPLRIVPNDEMPFAGRRPGPRSPPFAVAAPIFRECTAQIRAGEGAPGWQPARSSGSTLKRATASSPSTTAPTSSCTTARFKRRVTAPWKKASGLSSRSRRVRRGCRPSHWPSWAP